MKPTRRPAVSTQSDIITLTTDFGLQDWFVGTMKGVILGICPAAQIIDITHEIAPGDVTSAAFVLARSWRFFPPGTIHVVVVDPGVGTERAALAIEADSAFFIGPDNGVLWPALGSDRSIYKLTSEKYRLESVSRTFHGRDIFAPAAAHLRRGVAIYQFGPKLDRCEQLALPTPFEQGDRVTGLIVYIDRFGNAITNISEDLPFFQRAGPKCVGLPGRPKKIPLVEAYQEVPLGDPLGVLGSTGFLEVAIHGGNAAQTMPLQVGDSVYIDSRDARS